METFADDQAVGIDDDGAHTWVGIAEGSARSKLERTTHQRDVALSL
jgi:hypothetical protein